jgi:hypothetical protein
MVVTDDHAVLEEQSTYPIFLSCAFTLAKPIAYGGFCDVYSGMLEGVSVAIKLLRVQGEESTTALTVRLLLIVVSTP